MTSVFFTTDVEIWCDGWHDIARKFPSAFKRYIYGPTSRGDRGLVFQLSLLADHGLKGTFFVEPLFALRFGIAPLAEIVGLVLESGQEVQLHLHTEWVDEAKEPLLENVSGKRQYIKYFSREDQTRIVAMGKDLLQQAGAPPPVAFRAGSFALNRDTLLALTDNDIPFDSSFNACRYGPESGVAGGRLLFQPVMNGAVREYPVTVYEDRPGHFRNAQLGACAFRELAGLLRHAHEYDWEAVVIVSHGFELLKRDLQRLDPLVDRRFRRLCRFLDRHRNILPTRHFAELPRTHVDSPHPAVYRGSLLNTGWRVVEQACRRLI